MEPLIKEQGARQAAQGSLSNWKQIHGATSCPEGYSHFVHFVHEGFYQQHKDSLGWK